MKTAEEILRALSICTEGTVECYECPYTTGCVDCMRDLMVDAEELIEHLLEEKQKQEEEK